MPTLTPAELGAILAGLRLYQREQATDAGMDDAIADIATNEGEHPPMTADEVDALCLRLNSGSVADATPASAYRQCLADVVPFAESRAEDLSELAEEAADDGEADGAEHAQAAAASAWEAVHAARAILGH